MVKLSANTTAAIEMAIEREREMEMERKKEMKRENDQANKTTTTVRSHQFDESTHERSAVTS